MPWCSGRIYIYIRFNIVQTWVFFRFQDKILNCKVSPSLSPCLSRRLWSMISSQIFGRKLNKICQNTILGLEMHNLQLCNQLKHVGIKQKCFVKIRKRKGFKILAYSALISNIYRIVCFKLWLEKEQYNWIFNQKNGINFIG